MKNKINKNKVASIFLLTTIVSGSVFSAPYLSKEPIIVVQAKDGLQVNNTTYKIEDISYKYSNKDNSSFDVQVTLEESVLNDDSLVLLVSAYDKVGKILGIAFEDLNDESVVDVNLKVEERRNVDYMKAFVLSSSKNSAPKSNAPKTKYITKKEHNGFTSSSKFDPKSKKIIKEEIVPQASVAIANAFPETFGRIKDANIGMGFIGSVNSSIGNTASVKVSSITIGEGKDKNISLSYSLTLYEDNLFGRKRDDEEAYISNEIMKAMMSEVLTAGMIDMTVDGEYESTSKIGFPTWFKEGMAQVVGGGAKHYQPIFAKLSYQNLDNNFVSNRLKEHHIRLENIKTENDAIKYGTGYLACMYLGGLIGDDDFFTKEEDRKKNKISAEKVRKGLDSLMSKVAEGYSLDKAIELSTKGKTKEYSSVEDFEKKFADDGAEFSIKLYKQIDNAGFGSVLTGNLETTDILTNQKLIGNSPFVLDITNSEIRNYYQPNKVVITGGLTSETGYDENGNYPKGEVPPTKIPPNIK